MQGCNERMVQLLQRLKLGKEHIHSGFVLKNIRLLNFFYRVPIEKFVTITTKSRLSSSNSPKSTLIFVKRNYTVSSKEFTSSLLTDSESFRENE